MNFLREILTLIIFCCSAIQYTACHYSCPRDRTRLVRNILKEKVYPLYKETKTQIPEKCPFSPERDKYLIQEEHKVMEYMSKWYCNFCGKGFYTEMHLDLHFDNRHPEYTRKDGASVCYADYCDIMRCDVLAGNIHPDFWEVSLCLEEDMKDLAKDCEKYLSECLPAGTSKNSTEFITMKLYDGICSYLTCKKYWETPEKKDTDGTILYSVVTVFMLIVFIIYYCVAYHYYFTDTFEDSYDYAPPPRKSSSYRTDTTTGSRRRIIQDIQMEEDGVS